MQLLSALVICTCLLVQIISSESLEDVIVYTVASEETDGYERFIRSAKANGIDVQVLGLNEPWRGGDMSGVGGGYKINLLKEALSLVSGETDDKIVLFTDSYDVIFTTPLKDIIRQFRQLDGRVLFSAEAFCWPEPGLADSYPPVETGNPYLNSGMFMGYYSDIKAILDSSPVNDTDDDQLFYTKVYLDEAMRTKHQMKLDHQSDLFFNLNGASAEAKLSKDDADNYRVENIEYFTFPSVIHGNGPSKLTLNMYGNYIGGAIKNAECVACKENQITLDEHKLPTVTLAVFVENAQPFFEEFLMKLGLLHYPKDKMHLYIHSNVPYHDKLIKEYMTDFGDRYENAEFYDSRNDLSESKARNLAVERAAKWNTDYIFVVDADSHLDNPETLRVLMQQNRKLVAPLMSRPGSNWSNFWGAIAKNGYYQRSFDYVSIVERNQPGIYNVPFVTGCYLAKREIFPKMMYDQKKTMDPDMVLCESLRSNNIFMYVLTTELFGHLVNNGDFDVTRTHPDFYTLFSNKVDWEARYIHPNFSKQLEEGYEQIQPCTDVYWFAIATDRFCDDLVNISETFGQWSSGKNEDDRLAGGYEAVPTRDIHMNQVGLDRVWLKFLQDYVRPLQEKVFIGYFHNPPQSMMNFIVRYRPDEQPALRPHHDSSTYTINIALNRVGIDYEGGGCKFLRYNCSVTATKKGWMLMHPGRLTHFHEGLRTTKGTRYIMVSFINP